ncbi:unnamed protein product [Paramecium sonneborni]|uniref:Uncharacterized protein n=1 Tax=Paramecium sonneborni TaxID=65129 RepID=A0A8S1M7W4_9CILI|nr:unnamed protein product [Paramecium sonneborni]
MGNCNGEEVQGNIYLNIGRGSFLCSTIYLKVKGSEKAKWSETKTIWETIPGTDPPQTQSKQVTEYYDNENEFYQHKIPVYIFQQGIYQDHLNIQKKTESVEIDSPSKSLDKIKYQQEFLVREPIKEIVKQTEGQQVLQPTSCCCITAWERYFLSFSLIKQLVNQVILLNYKQKLITQSKVIDNLIKSQHTCYNRIVSKQGLYRLIHRVCGNSIIPRLQPGQASLNEQRKNMTLTQIDQNQNKPLDPTTNGKVVMNNYQLSAVGELDGICLCCTQTPGIEFPLRIVVKQYQVMINQLLLLLDGILKL